MELKVSIVIISEDRLAVVIEAAEVVLAPTLPLAESIC
jgi:hypothetical protein